MDDKNCSNIGFRTMQISLRLRQCQCFLGKGKGNKTEKNVEKECEYFGKPSAIHVHHCNVFFDSNFKFDFSNYMLGACAVDSATQKYKPPFPHSKILEPPLPGENAKTRTGAVRGRQ